MAAAQQARWAKIKGAVASPPKQRRTLSQSVQLLIEDLKKEHAPLLAEISSLEVRLESLREESGKILSRQDILEKTTRLLSEGEEEL